MANSSLPDGRSPQSQEEDPRRAFVRASQVASQVTTAGSSVVMMAMLGYGVDYWLGWAPVGVVVGSLLGLSLGGVQIGALVQQLNRAQQLKRDQQRNQNNQNSGK